MPTSFDTIAAETTAVLDEISRADSKASALLAALGLPLAALIAVLPGRELPTTTTAVIATGTGGLVAAMLIVLHALTPRLAGPRWGYLRWAASTPEHVHSILSEPEPADAVERLIKLSQIARTKYLLLRAAGRMTAGAALILAIASVTTW